LNIVLIYNYPLHYREAIFKKLDIEYDVDFYFGDKLQEKIKAFDVNELNGTVRILKNVFYKKRVLWRRGVVSLAFKKYDKYIVLGEFHNLSLWLLLILLKIRNKGVYNWTHGYYGKEGLVTAFFKKIFFSLNTDVLVYGAYAKKMMIQNGVREDKIKVICNSLDYDRQKKIRDNLSYTDIYVEHFKNDYDVVMFSGRLTKIKNIDLLVKTHKLIVDDYGENINVVIVGDGEEKDNLIAEVAKNKLSDNYWFFGETYDEKQIAELYYNASVCVSPGNVGLTAMHAMVYGCPVITHSDFSNQMPEFEAIDSGKTGFFFKRNSAEDLSRCIVEWLRYSSENREDIRKRCYMKIDEFYNPYYQMSILRQLINE